jgi:uncharacterized protein with FMN-binding domain
MGFKRPIMIAGGTVSAVAAVLSYHPAQSSTGLLTQSTPLGSAVSSNQQTAPTPDTSATPSKSAATATKPQSAPASSQSPAPTQTPTPSSPTPTPTPTKTVSASQTITGPVISTRWGPVQVQIVVENGQIVGATGLQYPSDDRRSLYISEQAVPMLVDLTLQAQSADGIPRIGGATYTSNGWKTSLAAALRNI